MSDENIQPQTPEDTNLESDRDQEDRLKALEQNQEALRLLSDPDIRAVLDLKNQGKPVKVVDEPQPDPVDELLKTLPEDDPSRELISKIDQIYKNRIDALSQKIETFEHVAQELQKREVQSEVSRARSKYPDFDQHREKMLELSVQNPSLGVEDLYVLAKLRSGKLELMRKPTEIEKPTHQPIQRREGKKRDEPLPPGRRGFSRLLAESLANLDF